MFALEEVRSYHPADWPFAVVDGAAAPGLGGQLLVRKDTRSLFAAPADRELGGAAPYLVGWGPSASNELMPALAGCNFPSTRT